MTMTESDTLEVVEIPDELAPEGGHGVLKGLLIALGVAAVVAAAVGWLSRRS